MDYGTLIATLAGWGVLLWGMMSLEDIGTFGDWPSVAITCGGSFSATLISITIADMANVPKVLRIAFAPPKQYDPVELINTLVKFGEIARRDGILALEGALEGVKDDFLIRGIQMAVDGSDPELIYQTMNTELNYMRNRHADGKKTLDLMAKFAPAFGMIGTLIGLIVLLKNLDDPSLIGPSMAVALITTFYGAMMANLVFGPLGEKLSSRDAEEALIKEIIIQGVMSIQSGDNPKIVEQKLRIFLPPRLREKTARK